MQRTISTIAQLRIEPLAQRPDLLPIVAAWIYHEWWTSVAGETVDSLNGLLRAHLTYDRLPLTLVASVELCPVGTATLLDHDVGTDQWPEISPWLAALYVVPEHRHRGIGAALVDAVTAKAAALGVEALYLLTIGREGFYARLGWEVADRSGGHVVMSKRMERNVRS